MVEPLDHRSFDDGFELVEIPDHPLRGPALAERPFERDLEAIRMPVQPAAFSGMMRQHVGGLEGEMFADLHDVPAFAQAVATSSVGRRRLFGKTRFSWTWLRPSAFAV